MYISASFGATIPKEIIEVHDNGTRHDQGHTKGLY